MAMGRYSRVDGRKSSSYCSTVTVVVFVAVCLVGVWMLMSSSIVPVQNPDVPFQNTKNVVKPTVRETESKQYEDSSGDLPEDATKRDETTESSQENQEDNTQKQESNEEKTESGDENKITVTNEEEEKKDGNSNSEEETDTRVSLKSSSEEETGENKLELEEKEKQSEPEDTGDESKQEDSVNNQNNEDKVNNQNDEDEVNKQNDEDKVNNQNDEDKLDQNQEKSLEETAGENKPEVFPSGAQSEILNETTTQDGSWSTQARESKNEKESQALVNEQKGHQWKLCNVTAGQDYIPCLDNEAAIRKLTSRSHYEHRERHCPDEGPTCLVTLPEGYKLSVKWPNSRDKIWYSNVPHTKLAVVKGHQNWVKVTGEYLTFPGGGTQFKNGALHYIDFIKKSVPDIAWGKRSRVILDVGCGVASFGGYLFERDVLAMSFAPKDEHEAQVQFALERGIPAISAVMGTKRLPFPGRVFDIVHCARCRVPWHVEGGKLLLELNRVLRPGGYFVWSATPVYQKLPEDVGIWKEMSRLTKAMCWDLVTIEKDELNDVAAAIYRKPSTNECYEKRSRNEPPLCKETDDPNAAWNVPLEACMHKVPVDETERGSRWPEQWPARVKTAPYWLKNSQVGVYGKPALEDFTSDYKHWKNVVSKSYMTGMGIDWSTVRNVMDMRAIYGGFAAALKDVKVWVMNVVPIDSPDTLPIIYERGLFGLYHDWCESFSTYPRSYDLLHADHLFSSLKKRCKLEGVIAEVDRILRPEGKLIVRDDVETIGEVENLAKSLHWEVRLTYSKDKEGLLCVQKSFWRPTKSETVSYKIA